jgi:hypothetical protein
MNIAAIAIMRNVAENSSISIEYTKLEVS